jgi:hypothetical protein
LEDAVSVFDLLFILLFLASAGIWITAASMALSGAGGRALRILRAWAMGFGAYMAVVATTSLAGPRRVLRPGDPLCSDDWCLFVESATRTVAGGRAEYRVNLRISSRALRVAQREKDAAVYLEDGFGRRYAPLRDPSAVPLDVRLEPGESIATARVFELPQNARAIGMVFRHEGGFPIGWLIIGYETWFRAPTLFRLDQ